jgi:hypothetical protein
MAGLDIAVFGETALFLIKLFVMKPLEASRGEQSGEKLTVASALALSSTALLSNVTPSCRWAPFDSASFNSAFNPNRPNSFVLTPLLSAFSVFPPLGFETP